MRLELQRFAPTYPELMASQVEVAKTALSGLFRFELIDKLNDFTHPPIKSLKDSTEVNESLVRYKDFINSNNINILVALHTKKGTLLPGGDFLLSDPFRETGDWMDYSQEGKLGGKFFVDGTFGFALGYRPSGVDYPVWLSITSFSEIYQKFNIDNVPLILQLQGPSLSTHDNKTYKLARFLLESLRWESLLIRMTADWARATGFSSVYLLPAHMNRWVQVSDSISGKIRYDGTAKHNGFKKDPTTGLYLLSLT